MNFFDFISSEIRSKIGNENLILEVPRDRAFGDFATNVAMQMAKSEHKSPREIAAGLIPKILEIPFIETAEIAGAGFINIKIKNDFIIQSVNRMVVGQSENPEIIDLDYGAYNVAKTMHIGHLRGSIVGDTFYRIARFLGHKPISYNHIGDWGRPMALVIAWIQKEFPDTWNAPDFMPDKFKVNNEYYIAASAFAKENPEFLEHVLKIKKEFQDGHVEYFALYEKILKISLIEMDYVVKRLNIVPFDNNLGERNAAQYLEPVEKILREKNMLKLSDGATIIELKRPDDTAPMPPFMFYDSRGADTYDSTDLATTYYRKITDNPDKLIYMSDARQNLHFTQLFRTSAMAGIFPESAFEALGYGSINGHDGRPLKTRDGGAATLTCIIDMVEDAVRERVAESGKALTDDAIKIIALAALKFNDLMHDVKSDYVFDPAAVTNFEGRTGPYILYTAVRLNSALRKSSAGGQSAAAEISDVSNDFERGMLMKILEFPRIVQSAFDRRAPDILANYTYDLCQLANGFYHNCPIKDDVNRIAITQKVGEILGACIDLMGLSIPVEM